MDPYCGTQGKFGCVKAAMNFVATSLHPTPDGDSSGARTHQPLATRTWHPRVQAARPTTRKRALGVDPSCAPLASEPVGTKGVTHESLRSGSNACGAPNQGQLTGGSVTTGPTGLAGQSCRKANRALLSRGDMVATPMKRKKCHGIRGY